MTAKLLEGKPISEAMRAQVKVDVEALKAKGVTPKLVAILAGDNPGAKFYAGAQEKACAQVGIAYELQQLSADVSQADLEENTKAFINYFVDVGLARRYPDNIAYVGRYYA